MKRAMGPVGRRVEMRGVQSDAGSLRKLRRLGLRIGVGAVHLEADGETGARLRFSVQGYEVLRSQGTLESTALNMEALVRWFEQRVKTVERGIDSLEQAFADCIVARPAEPVAPPQYASGPEGAKTVRALIALFRVVFTRFGIPESGVKVTWDSDARWARLRMRLPSGRIVEKRLQTDPAKSGHAALGMLALWLVARGVGREQGWERASLDDLFAGHLAPEALAPEALAPEAPAPEAPAPEAPAP